MAFSDYTSALETLRTHIGNQAWGNARDQLMVCRAWLASLAEGSTEGKSVKFLESQLDKLEESIKARHAAGNSPNRLGTARTSYR